MGLKTNEDRKNTRANLKEEEEEFFSEVSKR